LTTSALISLEGALQRLGIEFRQGRWHQDPGGAVDAGLALLREAEAFAYPDTLARARLILAELLYAADDPDGALAQVEALVQGLGQRRAADLQARALALAARCHLSRTDWPALDRVATDGIRRIEAHRDRIKSAYLQADYLHARIALYSLGVRAALELGDLPLALTRAELSKARGAASLGVGVPPGTARIQALAEELATLNARLQQVAKAGGDPTPVRERRRLLWSLFEAEGARAAAIPAPIFDWQQVRSRLAVGQAVLYYYWLDDRRLLRLVCDRDDVAHRVIEVTPAVRQRMAGFVAGILAMAEPPNWTLPPEINQFRDLLWPGEDENRAQQILERAERLLISPHRLLHGLPFPLLRIADRHLIARWALSLIPNLTSLLAPPPAAAESCGARSDIEVLCAGVSDYHSLGRDYRQLKSAETEVRAIADIYADTGHHARALTDDEVTAEGLRRHGAGARVLHLAYHGENVRADTPFESSLVLADGLLDGMQVPLLGLRPRLVVLSACCSAQRAIYRRGSGAGVAPAVESPTEPESGPESPSTADIDGIGGDDLFGLQATFFACGARHVVGALYPVDDRIAPPVCERLHRGLAHGEPPDLALQRAVLGFIAGASPLLRRPGLWGTFQLVSLGADGGPFAS